MEEEIQQSYYAILPANVRYDKDLTPNAKLLYAEITSLCNAKGYCWATNKYFADLYGVTKISISNWISELEKKGYIENEIIYADENKQILGRHLKICNIGIKEIFNRGIKENFNDNIKNNNIKKESNRFTPPTRDEVLDYARSKNAVALGEKFYDYFVEGNWKDSKGNKVKNWKQKFLTWLGHTTPDKSNFSTGRQYTREEMNSLFQSADEIEI